MSNKKPVSNKKTSEVKMECKETGLNNPHLLKAEVLGTSIKNQYPDHKDILNELLNEIEEVDFTAMAFPQVLALREDLKSLNEESDNAVEIRKQIDKLKVSTKHHLVISIEQTLKLATEKEWGLCKNLDFIYLYNGAYWNPVEKDELQSFLGEGAEKMGVEKIPARYYQFREQLVKQFLSTAHLPSPNSPSNKVLINLKNGTFEISPKKSLLRTFNQADFLTYQLPFDYDENTTAPLFHKYLDEVLPDKSCQMVLAEFIAYLFVGNSSTFKEEKALILYGTGANGKSVFFEIVNALLGDSNVSNYSLQSLTDSSGYYRAKLANKLVNYASELNSKLESTFFKQLVSGEPIEARLPYGQPFTLTNYAKLIFNCNELPKNVEQTNAYFRRFLIIPFEVTIPEQEQDKTLHSTIIESELSGVFNWVLEGLTRLLEQGKFTRSVVSEEALEQYKTESNSLKLFLDDNNYQKSTDKYFTLAELYSHYKDFCQDEGMHPFKKRNFSRQLKACGISQGRESGTGRTIFYLAKFIPEVAN
jgi:putative DNA primase/helicase